MAKQSATIPPGGVRQAPSSARSLPWQRVSKALANSERRCIRYAAPTGSRSRAIRSWMLRISGRRVRIAVTASTAALVADIVVR